MFLSRKNLQRNHRGGTVRKGLNSELSVREWRKNAKSEMLMKKSNEETYKNGLLGPGRGELLTVKMRLRSRKINQGSRVRKRRKRVKRLKVE